MAFEDFRSPAPFPAITVIVGKNDCCKTALLKLIYTVGKVRETFLKQSAHGDSQPFKEIISTKLQGTYGLKKKLGNLVRKNGTAHRLSVSAYFSDNVIEDSISFSFGSDTRSMINDIQASIKTENDKESNYVFVPAKEVVSAFNAIKAISRQYYFPGYDDTTLDLIDLLDIPVTSTSRGEFDSILTSMHSLFSGELQQTNDTERFRYYRGGNEYSMSVTAEGVKHIGILSTLIRNGQIHKGTVLLMDEPEDNLHPEALRSLIKILVTLSKLGVQIFLTTHSYFTLKQLEIEAKRNNEDVLCCSLSRNDQDIVVPIFSNLKEGMVDNDIVKASLEMYDEEISTELRN